MPSKYQVITEMEAEHLRTLTVDTDHYMDFLTTAANNFKYSFQEQLLIFAQKPDATACAEVSWWNKHGRWVNRNTKGIALLVDTDAPYKLRHVFDVSDTNSRAGKEVPIWKMEQRFVEPVKKVLAERYEVDAHESLEDCLLNVAVTYAADTIKTEERAYVSCLNCREDNAAVQMMETKRYWGKTDGRLCFHGYQSFAAGEVTAETAHAIGVKLAEELWGERFEVVIATHCNTGHYHNHFVINSVSWADGYKFNNSKSDYAEMRKISDRLCREHAISVIDVPSGKGKHYAQWSAEKNGKPTYRSMIRADIDRAIRASTTERDFIRIMQKMGYELKTRGKSGEPLKYPAIKPPDAKGYFRFHKLGEEYSLDAIKDRILDNISKQYPFPAVEHHAPRKFRVRGKVRRSVTGLQALYFRYCYELHILVKHPTSVKRVSFLLKEDITKLDRLDAQTRL